MPNLIDSTGIQTKSYSELVSYFTSQYQSIYGADINLSSNSPDGQMMNIFIQAIMDTQDLLVQVFNSFDPDNAIGTVLDQRVSINGIQRIAGTYTVTNITVVTSQSCTLYGLDQNTNPVYTVADNAGNQWQLQATQYPSAAGTYIYSFQSATVGANYTVPNTITTPVTIVLGVTSVNNPTTYTTLGINEETDAALKLRRQISVSLASQGYLKGLLAALENINGVTSAYVYENTTGTTDSNGVPGHSIWCIVGGSPNASEVANAIYQKRNAGCGMYGSNTYNITQVDGSTFTIYWDSVSSQNLFINFTASSIDGVNLPDIAAIRSGLVTSFTPGVYEQVDVNELATKVQNIDKNCLVTNAGYSTALVQVMNLSGVAASGSFYIAFGGNTSAAINWNDSISTIQTKVQAVSGLGSCLVTGSIATQQLTFTLSGLSNAIDLIVVVNNTLQTSAPAAITFSYNENYQNILTPLSKKYQFAVTSPFIIITPIIISPYNPLNATPLYVARTTQKQLTALGGYDIMTWSISVNNSGGSINSSGLYTAGSTPNVIDTIKVVDSLGNTSLAYITVT